MQEINVIKEIMKDREKNYRFFSHALLYELSENAILMLKSDSRLQEASENENIKRGNQLLKRYFAFHATDCRTELACDYARIFLAAGVYTETREIAVPYESVFTSTERLMMQDARDQVRDIFLREGFRLNPSLHEPEDHIGFLLEFLAESSKKTLHALESNDYHHARALIERQAGFIEGHLLNWLPDLCEAVERYAQTTFYLGMLYLLRGYLEEDLVLQNDIADALAMRHSLTHKTNKTNKMQGSTNSSSDQNRDNFLSAPPQSQNCTAVGV
ncbi:MAG: molecular chaperone TorD family protein [Coriobacteriales bacterium]|jgi:TorA maturation chaperone TorD|nr:molecular chaperone TorD family protein [Coriobacteriales bacterium]